MKNRLRNGLMAAVSGLFLMTPWSVAQGEVPTVSLLDFETAADGRDCSWAARAIPDLLQIQLQGHELQLLDRQLIRAVLREQRFSVAGITETDSIRAAGLLGAQWLVTGRFTLDAQDHFQIIARIVSVATLETKQVLNRTGAYPDGLERALSEMAQEVAGSVAPARDASSVYARAAGAGNIEALILFHRGLDVYARGWPAVASVWFGKAYHHDPRLRAAGLWEIKAYDAAGLSFHAELAREIMGEEIPDSATATDVDTGHLALAVMNPVAEQLSTGDKTTANMATLKSKIEQSVLAVPGVRLVNPESLGAAAAESDLKLSGLIREDGKTHYGNWLTADYLLFSRVGLDEQGVAALKLDLVEAASGNMVRREVAGAGIGPDSGVAEAVGRLVGGLAREQPEDAPPADISQLATNLDVRLTYGLLPDEINLANQLFSLSRDPGRRTALFALSRIYQSRGQERHAAMVAKRLIDTLDIHAPDADLDVYETCTWLNLGEDCPKLEEFLRTQPATLAAIMIRYGQCYQFWMDGDEQKALRHLTDVIDGLARVTLEEEVRLFGPSGRAPVQHALAGGYYMRGKTQMDQGNAAQALADFQVAMDVARMHPLASRPLLKLNLANRPRMSQDRGKPRWVIQEDSGICLVETAERALQRLNSSPPTEETAPANKPPTTFVQRRLEEAVGEVETVGEVGERIRQLVAEADRDFEAGEYERALDRYRSALQEADAFERPLPAGTYGIRKRTKQGALTTIVGPREAILNWSQLDETVIERALQENSSAVPDGVRRLAASLAAPDWYPSWHDWYNAALRHQAKGEYDLAVRLHQAALEAGVKEYGWTAGPDHAWVEKLADNYMARDPERRWFNSAYNLALCLVQTSPEEAAPWLRMLGYAAGSRSVMLYSHMLENGFQSKGSLRIGEEAAKMLDDLHRAPGSGNPVPAGKEE